MFIPIGRPIRMRRPRMGRRGVLALAVSLCLPLAHALDSGAAGPETPASGPASVPARAAQWGTGFVVAPGYVLTAYHVVSRPGRLIVGPVGMQPGGRPKWAVAEILKTDPAKDLALLKIPDALPALRLSQQVVVPVGLEAFVVGYPLPRLQGSSRKISQGIVNGYRNSLQSAPDQGELQISAEVSQGNSGGPVFAADGTVIGMVQRKVNAARVAEMMSDAPTNVSYAIRSHHLVEFLKGTPAQPTVGDVSLQISLRGFQIYELSQSSVLAVIALGTP